MARQLVPLLLIMAAFIGGAFYFLHYASTEKATSENFRKVLEGQSASQVEKVIGTRTTWVDNGADARMKGLQEAWARAREAGAARLDCWESGDTRFLLGFDKADRVVWKGSKP